MAKKKKGAAAAVAPEVAAREAKRLALIDKAAAVQKELRKEEAEIVSAQLNKFQLHRNWAMDKERVKALQAAVREKDGLIEDTKVQQVGEVRELKKKLKDYLLDLQEEAVGEGVEGEVLNKQAQDAHRNILTAMRTDLRSLKQTYKEREGADRNMKLHLRRSQDRACYDARRVAERKHRSKFITMKKLADFVCLSPHKCICFLLLRYFCNKCDCSIHFHNSRAPRKCVPGK